MPFNDEVVGGKVLIRPAIQSPNYVPGVSGWTINRDGTAEFASATIRGQLVIGAAPHSRTFTQTIPNTVDQYYVTNYATHVTAIDIKSIDASQYVYEVLLDGSTTYITATGQVIINSNTLAEEVFETGINTIATDDSVTVQPPRMIIGNGTNPTTRPARVEYIDQTQLAYNGIPMTITRSDDDALTGGPFTLGTGSTLSNCAVTYTSAIATAAQPAKAIVTGIFDFEVTAISAGNLCEGQLDHNGTIQSALALLAMNNLTRITVVQQWRININNRNAHTFTLGYLKAAAGGTAVLHAVHTTIMLEVIETLA